ncbi:MAG: 2,3-bisphosphoglycerate-independent phosphoglycerate mutase [Bacteroidota bacterium]
MDRKVILMILDGWGLGTNPEVSAIEQANTPFVDSLFEKYKHSKLDASGLAVGLPKGQMGNSEVGHMNIGAGRVVYQDLVRINKSIEDGEFGSNEVLRDALSYAKENNKNLHLIGLISDGGVHSHLNHAKAICSEAEKEGLSNVYLHAFTDGRDTDPKSGLGFLKEVEEHMNNSVGKIASVVGRYYAMDRDKRWERVKLAYDTLVKGSGTYYSSVEEGVQASYDNDVTDEFIKPIIISEDNETPIAKIQDDDVVICFNFRTDRGREITLALTQQSFEEQEMEPLNLEYITMTNYDKTFKGVKVMFEKDNLNNTLGEVLQKEGKQQIRIAETEKYPHVTFFFSGGREEPFEGEHRILCPSPKVATYDLQPEMSAGEIRDKINVELEKEEVDFICLNFANPDMVGHTGVFEAAVKACETVDGCAKDVIETGLEHGYSTIVIADHGNSDIMKNPDGSPNTAHTTNLVPCILVDKEFDGEISDGKLGDLAPTILKLMGIGIPSEMKGDILIK